MRLKKLVAGVAVFVMAVLVLPFAASSVAQSAAPAVVREAASTVAVPQSEAFYWCPGWFCCRPGWSCNR